MSISSPAIPLSLFLFSTSLSPLSFQLFVCLLDKHVALCIPFLPCLLPCLHPCSNPSPPPHSLSPFSVVSFTPYLVVSGQNVWYSCQHLNPVFSAEMTWAELLNVLTLYLTEESMKYCDPESGSNSNSQRDSTVPSLVPLPFSFIY